MAPAASEAPGPGRFLLDWAVSPFLENSVRFWGPRFRKDVEKLKRAQKRITKIVGGLEKMPANRD